MKNEGQSAVFSFDEKLIPYRETGSMVLRIEHLLAGKSLDTMLNKASELYNFFLSYYEENLDYYKRGLENFLTAKTKEDDQQVQEYFYVRTLCDKKSKDLSSEEKGLIYYYYEQALHAIENGENRIAIAPTKTINSYEHFLYDELEKKESILDLVKASLKNIIIEPQQVFLEDRIRDVARQIEFLTDCRENRICFAVNREILFEYYDQIKQLLYDAKKRGKRLELVVDDDGQKVETNTAKRRMPYTYTTEQMRKLGLLTRELKAKLYFSEFYTENFMPYNRDDLWGFKEVMLANYQRHAFVNSAKPLGLTPFEKIIATSEYMTECKYTGEATPDEKTRTMLTAERAKTEEGRAALETDGKSFVCTSFASTAKAIMDDFGDENIECKFLNICYFDRETKRKKLSAVHAILLIHITDEAYGMKGYYLWDPTWNSGNGGVTHCLFPVADIENYTGKGSIIDENLDLPKAMLYLYSPRKEEIGKNENNQDFREKYEAESPPIAAKTYETALTRMYQKAKKSAAFAKKYKTKQILEKPAEELAAETMNTTFQHLSSFEPERAVNDFYRQVCRYYIENSDEFTDFLKPDNWKEYLKKNSDYKKILK